MTTINDLISTLQEVPEEKRNLPIYVCNEESSDNFPVKSVSRHDTAEGYGETNPLGINFAVPELVSVAAKHENLRTEEQAMDEIASIRARFDMVGTEFVKADIEDHVRGILEELPSDVAECLAPIYVQQMVEGFSWKALRDIIIARGNEHLGDSVAEMVGIPTDAQFGPEYAIRVTSHDSNGEVLRDTRLNKTAASLVEEIEQAKNIPGAVEVTINGIYFTEDGTQRPMGDLLTVWSI